MLHPLFQSVLDQDTAPVVICDKKDVIVYRNPSAIRRYHKNLTRKSIRECHPPQANARIDKVVSWFRESRGHNIVYTYRNEEENQDVYMVALRDGEGELIGYYEKHEFRNRETKPLYEKQ